MYAKIYPTCSKGRVCQKNWQKQQLTLSILEATLSIEKIARRNVDLKPKLGMETWNYAQCVVVV